MKKEIYIFNNISNASYYGIGKYIHNLLELLIEENIFKINVVNLFSKKLEFCVYNQENYSIIDIPSPIENCNINNYYKRVIFLLKSSINNQNYIFFHLNYINQNLLSKYLKEHFPKAKIIYTVHYFTYNFDNNNVLVNQSTDFYKKENDIIYEYADLIICLSNTTKNLLIRHMKINECKITVIYNCINDKPYIISKNDKIKLRKKFQYSANDKIVLFVGRLDKSKGLDYLIKAFLSLCILDSEYKLIVVGEGNFNNYLNLCSPLNKNVIFTGYIDEKLLKNYYQIADLGILPSFNEQCSFVVLEMIQNGLPCIGTSCDGLNEMFENFGVNLSFKIECKQTGDAFIADLKNNIENYFNNEYSNFLIEKKFYKLYSKSVIKAEYVNKVYT